MSFGRLQQMANGHIANARGLPAIDYGIFLTVHGAPVTVLKMLSIIHTGHFTRDICLLTHLTLATLQPHANDHVVRRRGFEGKAVIASWTENRGGL